MKRTTDFGTRHTGSPILKCASLGAPLHDGAIRNRNSGKCLEILSWQTGNGALAGQWECHSGANQKWATPAV
ncbi:MULTISPECIES: RICIN domain-containing protein [unclassified Streptomyces]|uniref:RICIN domain-containing protein n=1 Tax=unclassified Streptomyces TaxID=2593676 RepID=UPI00338F0ACA